MTDYDNLFRQWYKRMLCAIFQLIENPLNLGKQPHDLSDSPC
jgi:hypothetical protein